MILFLIFFAILGLIVGSFLNVVILRHNTGASLGGRSGCFSCGHNLVWSDLIPVVSFLFLRGRCRHCHCKISRQYPLVEILTSFLFVLSAWKFYPNILVVVFYALLMALLVVIVVYDLKHKIITNKPVYLFALLSLLSPAITGFYYLAISDIFSQIFANLIAGTVIFLFFFSLWYFSKGCWMGFGDAKLGFGIGALLGLGGAVNAVVLAFWLGALSGLILIALSKIKIRKIKFFRRGFSIKSEIPFAPFLVLGLILNLFWDITVFVF